MFSHKFLWMFLTTCHYRSISLTVHLLFHIGLVSGNSASQKPNPKETREKWINVVSHSELEQKLIDKLFENYSKKQKPPGTVDIKFALNLNSIINVIEKEQIFVLNTFVDHEWIDTRIRWEPKDFGNISILRISSETLWT